MKDILIPPQDALLAYYLRAKQGDWHDELMTYIKSRPTDEVRSVLLSARRKLDEAGFIPFGLQAQFECYYYSRIVQCCKRHLIRSS